MTKPLAFSAFVMNTPSHILQGLWHLPGARQSEFETLDVWIDLAKQLEAGGFDVLFFADVTGLYGRFHGTHSKYAQTGLQVPSNDPIVLLSALAAVTSRLGLAATSNVMQAHPFDFARRISTLDHASGGRIAWNIVTGYLENGARNFGHAELTAHDDRYDWADEYVDVVYKLWEGSWDDDAVVRDAATRTWARPERIHKINHVGPRYSVEGPHLTSPSPQRTPLLFQAGSSPRGRRFAAANAEAQFLAAPTPAVAAQTTRETRALAASFGRSPDDLKFFQGLSFVIGSTEEEAARKSAELDEHLDIEGVIAHMSGGMGVDLGDYPIDFPLKEITTEAMRSTIDSVRAAVHSSEGREATLADLGILIAKSMRVVGTPEQIADNLAEWRAAGVDGVNVINATIPASYTEFIDHVMPVLRERGLATDPDEGAGQTLRGRLFGRDRLPETHPAARYRGAFAENSLVDTEERALAAATA